MITALMLAALVAAPTPSPTLSPLPSAVINWYAAEGTKASGLDTALVRAVIDAESAGDPRAVSAAGAVGLMQLEPDTASDCGVSDRFDALSNVRCGANLLAGLVHRFGFRDGIAAYNFGPGNVENGRPWPDETKAYVASVIARYDALQHSGDLQAVAPTPSPLPDPCAHRIMCGPIHLVPRDPRERLAFFANMALSLADGIVTRNGLREQRDDLFAHPAFGTGAFGNPPAGSIARVYPTGWRLGTLRGMWEADPLMYPFSHDGLGSIVAGGIFWAGVQATLTRHWSVTQRTNLNYLLAASHVWGISTWAHADRRYARCRAIVHAYGDAETWVEHSGYGYLLVVHDASTPGYCADFTGATLSISPHPLF